MTTTAQSQTSAAKSSKAAATAADPAGPPTQPQATPAPGTFVTVTDEENNPIRFGVVVAEGRQPGDEESHEPIVLWFAGTPAPYGGELVVL